ncbi:MAG TPA: ATP-dependent DNA helicase RecG [Chloroflexia bacterium]|nr:ATP-dependent DNA helicase RecG [Chloroflexia bacterium]
MPIPISVFKNILRLEEHKGFTDAAVSGGLEAFAQRWAEQLVASERSAKAMSEAISNALRGYTSIPASGRQQSIARATELLSLYERGVREVPHSLNGEGNGYVASAIEGFSGFDDDDPRAKAPISSGMSGIAPAPSSPPTSPPASARVARRNATLESPVTVLRGVQEATARLLKRLGVYTVRDALLFFPFRYDDFSDMKPIAELEPGVNQTVVGTIWDVEVRKTRNNRPMVTATLADDSGIITVSWFNQEYIARQLHQGDPVVISGKPIEFNGRLSFNAPEWEPYDSELLHTGRIVPVYHSTEGLYRRTLRRIMHDAVERFADQMEDYLPATVKRDAAVIDIQSALKQIHFPDSRQDAAQARKRLAFDEFLMIQLGMLQRKQAWQQSQQGFAMEAEERVLDSFYSSLPFELTGAQRRVIGEILGDMAHSVPMTRLLQGDVGSGKTVVAAAALMVAVSNGAQGVLMAPTEILAEQHFKSLTRILTTDDGRRTTDDAKFKVQSSKFKVRSRKTAAETEETLIQNPKSKIQNPTVRLLKGSTPRKEKLQIYKEIASGEVDIVVGTHALIQEGVNFKRLALVVVDEQHRFGVAQRDVLRQKGIEMGLMPHTLVMTATPIPRSLALTIYGDLEVSVIDEMPPGRRLIKTRWVDSTRRDQAYEFIEKKLEEGRQAFIICPLVEESDKIEAKAATAEHERLQAEVFPARRLALLHGRMKPKEKDEVMARFHSKDADVLVSTSVVEVGIDVPNATVMLVDGADRFGLSQLHQFRGRVGRGEHQSYCILLAEDAKGVAFERMQIIQETHDGFHLAEEDLKIRGPGQFFGTRQSGMPDLRMAKLSDMATLTLAREQAKALFERDPALSKPEHAPLKTALDNFWSRAETEADQ